MLEKSTNEEGESHEEHKPRTLDKDIESPFLERVEFALTVSTALDQRSVFTSHVAGQELLPHHRGAYSGCTEYETHVEECDGDVNPVGSSLDRWNDKGIAWVEGEQGCRLIVRIGPGSGVRNVMIRADGGT